VIRIDRNGFAYHSKFKLWESRASVRNKPRRVLEAEARSGKLFFPPELVPVVSHPLIAAGGRAIVDEVLLQRLHVYLDSCTRPRPSARAARTRSAGG
jgi:hypothetical protein